MENWIESEESKQLAAKLQLSVGVLVFFFSSFVASLTVFILTPNWILALFGLGFLVASVSMGYRLHYHFLVLSGKHYYRIGQLDRLIVMQEKKLKGGWIQFKDEEPKNEQSVWLHTEKIFAPNVAYNNCYGKEWYYPEGKCEAKPEDYWMPFIYPEPPKVP